MQDFKDSIVASGDASFEIGQINQKRGDSGVSHKEAYPDDWYDEREIVKKLPALNKQKDSKQIVVEQVLKQARAFVAEKKQEGWTHGDFANLLRELFDCPE